MARHGRQHIEQHESDGNAVVASAIDLVKTYGADDAQVRALDHLSVDFARGEMTAIMGPSGSGKSTLMHCMAGLDQPTSGKVMVEGLEVSSMNQRQLTRFRREQIGFIFQSFNLVPTLSAEENILLPLQIAKKPIDRAWFDKVVSVVGLQQRLSHRPSQLSGGQQQRVACARAIMARPSVIFADEPTGNLDSRTSREVLGFLKHSVHEYGQTIVMVTHDPRAASYADRVLVLADGRITQDLRHPTYQEILKVFASDDDMNTDAMDYGAEDSKSADGRENARIAGTQVETHDADAHESNIEPTSNVDVPALVSPKLSIPKAEPFDARIGGNGAAA
ncbi:ABC transporter, ATP-binding protein [Bifidobacterium angulatum DSM 20098 = JCM 7096]|uniref:ABC transporter, ATP-binding protein n=1 Tax=Bifidobacterium angulatum DSM 20098 = JCM 7096 TaxID=518635 RepID=C4FEC3_9BIFI|nr:ABC transporter, ATP-binding protein [Bifidobacterium angulatum DSM 20098 = JCM 7096]KFI38860.1 ABC transporter, ATP-binding protein [Bifidobacterium angulatum]BAQ96207.1 putative ABC transporter ATP-binding component [Bifidobacterium angulatum DSM 20098 = JCM 7096]